MTYGVEVLGVSNSELKEMQRQALSAMTPATRGRSKSAVFTAKGDPTWRPAVAPVLRWAKEVWEAVSPSYPAAPRIPLKRLREVWEVVDKKPPKTWGASRSALDAAFLSLKRIGWRFSDPFHVTDDLHTSVSLINTNPKLLAKLLREGVQRHWHRRMAASLIKHGWKGERICPDPIVNLNHSVWARRNPLAALAANKLFCSAIWTKERAEDAGYVMDNLRCELCNAADDTIHHRIFACPCADEIRKRHRGTFKVMVTGKTADKWLYTKGIMAHPADRCPKPPAADGIDFTWGEHVPKEEQDLEKVGGHIAFCDGSAGRHPVAELRRAAWAVAFFNDLGQLQLKVAGPVWRHLPQTAQAAEYLSAMAAVQLMKRPTRLVGDCLGVVKAATALKDEGRISGLHSGLMTDALRPGRLDNLIDMSWMPSHRAVQEGASEYERLLHDGNEVVDEAAGDRRRDIEEEAGTKTFEDEANLCRKATSVLKAAGEVLALWPALPRSMERCQKGDSWSLRVTHTWTFMEAAKQWRCSGCGMFSARSFNQGPPTNFGRCRPGRLMERMDTATQHGHQIRAVQRLGVPVFYCSQCGSRGSWQWRNLLSPCQGCVKDNGTARWLRLAAEGSAALEAAGRAPRRRRFATRRRTQRAKATEERTPTPLGNKTCASAKDRRRWELLGGDSCMATVPAKHEDKTDDTVEIAPPCTAIQPKPPSPDAGPKLQPLPPDPDREPEDCPRCAAAVLASDTVCANCGLERASEAPLVDACAKSPVVPCARNASESVESTVGDSDPLVVACANSSVVPCARNASENVENIVGDPISGVVKISPTRPRKNARSCSVTPRQRPDKMVEATRRKRPPRASTATATKRGGSAAAVASPRAPIHNSTVHLAECASSWRWHGGTFAPPPYLLQERLGQDTAEPKAEPTARRPTCSASARPTARVRRKASPEPEPSGPSIVESNKPPEDPGPKAQEPSAAACRLMALHARIRAKEAAGR